ncbi:MAG: hypothetical protein Q9207_005781 [Kuettlingeria erythrocarpa]
MQPTEPTEQVSSSEPLGQTDLEAQGTLTVDGETQISASPADIPDLPPSTKESQVESPSGFTSSVSPTESSLSNGPSPVDSQLLFPTDKTEPVGADFTPTLAEASITAQAGPSDTFIPGGEDTPSPIPPEAPVTSQDAAILPPSTLENPPKPSDTTSDGPTATWTTTPPDFKAVVVTNTALTRDTLITTTSPGSDEPTMVPIFTNCDGCGPGGSLVLFASTGPPPGSSSNQDNDRPPQPGPPRREEEKGEDEDKGDDKSDDTSDDKNDDQEDDQDNQDDENDDQDDDQEDDQDDQDEEHEDEQSTTSQSSGATSSTSSSNESSTSTGTEGLVVTETAYIDVRPTDGFAGGADMDMNQYLLIAYSSLGIADEQLTDASAPLMEKSKLLGPTSIDPYDPRQTVGYLAEACGALADNTAPLAGGPFAGDHSYFATEPMESQSVRAHFVVSNNASVCDKTEPTVGDCKKWFGTIMSMCGLRKELVAAALLMPIALFTILASKAWTETCRLMEEIYGTKLWDCLPRNNEK